jgi:hypothetical protein
VLQIVATTDDPIPAAPLPEPEISFDDFWLLYPRHIARKDAVRAFDRVPKAQRVTVLIGLVAWRKVWLDRGEPEYTPYPASWLNGERWEDELPPGYSLMPRVNGHASAQMPQQEIKGERTPMPEHVRAMIAKLREGRK